MVHEVVGTARYCGKDPEIIKEFGRFQDTELYNCEGFYVLTNEGKQVVIDRDWHKFVTQYKSALNGKDIDRVYVQYENIVIVDKDEVAYYLNPYELKLLLRRSKFSIVPKRTRAWLTKFKK